MLDPSRLSWPVDWNALFGRPGPLLVEIGFGNAEFLVHMAQTRPEANILGLEISQPSLRKARRKLKAAGLDNVRLVHDRADKVLWAFCPPLSVHSLYINFPDPWPKPAHHMRRLISTSFLQLVASRVKRDAPLDIATDHAGYAEWIASQLALSPYFDSRLDRPYTIQDENRLRTKYELKALAQGRPCFYFKWRRNSVTIADTFPIHEELPMPHVVLSTPLTLNEIAGLCTTGSWRDGEITGRFIGFYLSVHQETLAIDTYLKEIFVDNRVFLLLTKREDGYYVIHLHDVGFPRSTPGVHAAVRGFAEFILSMHKAGRIIHHNLDRTPSHPVA